jgi:hypothetical protein
MVGEANEELDMEILRKRADGPNEVSGGPAATRRLPFDLIPDREVLAAAITDRCLDCLYSCLR